jgi:ribosomal protein S18 acetylase RimI-like enzyme
MRLAYRPETPDDEALVRTLLIETLVEHLAAWSWPEQLRQPVLETQYQVQRQGFRSIGNASMIVLHEDTPVGWYVTAESADEVRLVNLMVLSQHRGQGIGSTVLRTLLATSEATGKPLRLSVAVNNGRALQLYEQLGFQRIGGDEVHHYMEYSTGGCHAP